MSDDTAHLPWEGQAQRTDRILLGAIVFSGIYALALTPLVPSLVGHHALLLVILRAPAAPTGMGGPACLSVRERQVLALVARGLTNEEIAGHMVISPFTAKTHVSRAMTKLAARDRAQLVVFAYESGLVTPNRPA